MLDVGKVLEGVLIVLQIVIGLGFLIFIHEAGHFVVAKWKGVRVDAFSLGMGPILWKRFWKGTEYRISAIPLGGYVKMAGENIGDPKTGAPDELTSKSAWARLQIFAAGALMNLVIAFPLAILACLAGRTEGAPVIGMPSEADIEGGLRPADRILSVDGRPIASTDDYRKQMVRLPQGKQVTVSVERDGRRVDCPITVMPSGNHLTFPPATTLPRVEAGSKAHAAGLRTHDEILEIDGEDPKKLDLGEVRDKFNLAVSGTLKLKVRNAEEGEHAVELKNMPARKNDAWIPRDWRLLEPVIAEPKPKTPAAVAGLKADDRILRIDDVPVSTFQDIAHALKGRAGVKVTIEFERNKARQEVTARTRFASLTQGQLGIEAARTPVIASVPEGSVFQKAGLKAGDQVVTIVGNPNASVYDFAFSGRPSSAELEIRRGEATEKITIPTEDRVRIDFTQAGFETLENGQLGFFTNQVVRTWGFGGAVSAGLREPIDVIDITFRILGKLFVREEDPTGLAGPVGIFRASFFHAQLGLGNFLWLLVLITVNLGIFNLLPVPVLDGGHILLLAIEKLKGGPPSPRFVERFQLVGLVLLLSLLIFVTVNDLR